MAKSQKAIFWRDGSPKIEPSKIKSKLKICLHKRTFSKNYVELLSKKQSWSYNQLFFDYTEVCTETKFCKLSELFSFTVIGPFLLLFLVQMGLIISKLEDLVDDGPLYFLLLKAKVIQRNLKVISFFTVTHRKAQ